MAHAQGKRKALLEAHDLGKDFLSDDGSELEIIRSISFTLAPGEIVSLVGPSGCGKTTLLNLLCRLTEPSRGAVLWNGHEIGSVPPGVGYMLQKDLLLPWRTALGNVMLGLEVKGGTRAANTARAHALLDQLGLSAFAGHYPSTLPAACGNGWRLLERWHPSRTSCCSTNRSRLSTSRRRS